MRFWHLEASFETYMRFVPFDGRNGIEITRCIPLDELKGYVPGLRGRNLEGRSDVATALTINVESFDADFFGWGGCVFASRRMREAMALPIAEVRFIEVDHDRSAPLPRSMDYRLMEPEMTEDVSDPVNSVYRMTQYAPDLPAMPDRAGPIAFRADAAPTSELFYDHFFSDELLCTEAFALRVLRAGCSGMQFTDLSNRGEGILHRTLRGIERRVRWDSESRKDISELVQTID